jgi:wyosine [tRNA(Phe)-imidazoG37] synthetase (radical SAM superfamily)
MKVHEIRKSTSYPTPADILQSLQTKVENLDPLSPLNSIIISGNGEPTLHPQIYEVVKAVLEVRDRLQLNIPTFLLTHGGHVDNKRVVAALNLVDERVVKLDAGSDFLFKKISQPKARINPNKIIAASKKLNDVIVQAMFVQGVYDNTNREDIEDWIEVVGMIRPKLVQLCTPTRPHSTPGLKSVSEDTLDVIATLLRRRVNTEVAIYS